MPGAHTDIAVHPVRYQEYLKYKKRTEGADFNQADVDIESVVFDNTDLGWVLGIYIKRVGLGRWVRDESKY
jgi:hypothetical protein